MKLRVLKLWLDTLTQDEIYAYEVADFIEQLRDSYYDYDVVNARFNFLFSSTLTDDGSIPLDDVDAVFKQLITYTPSSSLDYETAMVVVDAVIRDYSTPYQLLLTPR